jgi:hypothetical protein
MPEGRRHRRDGHEITFSIPALQDGAVQVCLETIEEYPGDAN